MKTKRMLCALLLLVILMAAVAACGQTGPSTDQQTTAASTTSGETTRLEADVPDIDMNGYVFRVLTRNTDVFMKEVWADNLKGEVVNDAVYRRNAAIEKRFNIKIETLEVTESPESNLTDTFNRIVMAGDHEFDLALPHMHYGGAEVLNDTMYNWRELPYVDLEKPWWNQAINRELNYQGKQFLAVSDYCISAVDFTWVMLFNTQMQADRGIEDLYECVNKGEWTYDKFNTIVTGISEDLNHDNKIDYNDLVGFTTHISSAICNWMFAFDQKVTEFTDDGGIKVVLKTEKMADIVEKLYDLVYGSNSVLYFTSATLSAYGITSHDVAVSTKFASNETMFAALRIFVLERLRDMENYGIIPFPKYDLSQPNYYTHLDGRASLMCVPKTIENPEYTGIIIEALSADSYYQVMPMMMDLILPGRYARDGNAATALKTILDNRVYSFAFVFDRATDAKLQWSLTYMIRDRVRSFSTWYASREEAAINQYETLLAKLVQLGD